MFPVSPLSVSRQTEVSGSEKRIFVWPSLYESMKVHKSEDIPVRFIAVSVIPAIPKKSGRVGIRHSFSLYRALPSPPENPFHTAAVRALRARMTYATDYYYDISDRLSFRELRIRSRRTEREYTRNIAGALINHFNKMRI